MLPASGDLPSQRTISVEALIAQFDSNPFGMSRALRQLRDLDPVQFQQSALVALSQMPDKSGIRFVASLIPLNEPILELIANPKAFEQDAARRILGVMRRIDLQADAKLLRLISSNPAKPLPPPMTDRILDLVDAFNDGPRLVPALMQIFRTANPYLRARLSLSIGKHHRNKDWLDDRMRDSDPRVRANVVEANWRQKDEAAVKLFSAALRDPHHRITGNGAVGLYYAGDNRCLKVFSELLSHPEPHSRAAGLWAVGHIQDTRFQHRIATLAEDQELIVRRSFEVAHARLKRALEIRDEQPKLKLVLIKATRDPLPPQPMRQGGDPLPPLFRNHLFLEVKTPDGVAIQGMKSLQFHIFENDHVILDYSVQERTKYITPGTYDIYFDAATRPKELNGQPTQRHLKIVILTDCASGEHDTHDFDETDPKLEATDNATEPAVHAWDAFEPKM